MRCSKRVNDRGAVAGPMRRRHRWRWRIERELRGLLSGSIRGASRACRDVIATVAGKMLAIGTRVDALADGVAVIGGRTHKVKAAIDGMRSAVR